MSEAALVLEGIEKGYNRGKPSEVIVLRGAGDGQHIVQRHGDVGDHDLQQGRAEALALDAKVLGAWAFAVLDLHGQLSTRRVQNSNILVAFKEFPHTDFVERAVARV